MTDLQNKNNNFQKSEVKMTRFQAVLEVIQFLVISVLVVFGIRYFIAQPFVVSGESMVPTFQNSEYLIIDEISMRFNEIERGEVVVFEFPENNDKFFIKRIIALPGETIRIINNTVSIISADGTVQELMEPYAQGQTLKNTTLELEADEYFVMGDNRERSSDSRSWGPVTRDEIIGRPIFRLLPLTEIDYKPGDYAFGFDILKEINN